MRALRVRRNRREASMGPRSSDRGYDGKGLGYPEVKGLQWVHGPQTVVMTDARRFGRVFPAASMGPRSSDRGYGTNY